MTRLRHFVEIFDLALGRLIALFLGAIGGLLIYFSWHTWGDTATLVPFGLGLGLLTITGIMLYCRMTFLGLLGYFAASSLWN